MKWPRFAVKTGGLLQFWTTGFLSPTLTVKDPPTPWLPLETASAGGGQTLIQTAGIAATTNFGSNGQVNLRIFPASIAAATAFGANGQVNLRLIMTAGMAPSTAFGADGRINLRLLAEAIAALTVFGADGRLNLRLIVTAGIVPATAFGADGQVRQATVLIQAAGIPPATVFGAGAVVTSPAPPATAPILLGGSGRSRRRRRRQARPVPSRQILQMPEGIAPAAAFGLDGFVRVIPRASSRAEAPLHFSVLLPAVTRYPHRPVPAPVVVEYLLADLRAQHQREEEEIIMLAMLDEVGML